MAKPTQLHIEGKIFADPKPTTVSTGKLKCTFSILNVHRSGDIRKDGRWFNFVAWEETAEHILNNFRAGDVITISKATPKSSKCKCPACKEWVEMGVEWTVQELGEKAVPENLPDVYEQDELVSREVVLDDSDIPY